MKYRMHWGTALGLVLAWGPLLTGCASTSTGQSTPRGPGGHGPLWTILCLELSGTTSGRDAQRLADTLKSTQGIRADEVFVRQEGQTSRLYYGSYAWPDSKKGQRTPMPSQMRGDLALLKQLGDPAGGRYFLRAMPIRMPTANVGNPQWALSNAKGLYTLQVGVFEPAGEFTEYKEAAAEFCKLLREKGYEAFYHHTDAASMVTVGSFGKDAVVEPPHDHKSQAPGTVAIAVYHPRILAMQQEELLKYNLLNGGVQYVRKPDGSRVPVMSRLVEIPHASTTSP